MATSKNYSQDGYYSLGYGYGHGPSMHIGPTPSPISSHTIHFGGHGPYHHSTTDFYSNGSHWHMSSAFPAGSNFSHRMPTASYGSSYQGSSGKFSHGVPTSFGSSYQGASSNISHGMPTDNYGSSYHRATHSPMGSKVEWHDYNNYNYSHPSMLNSPMHGGHQSAEWKLKSMTKDAMILTNASSQKYAHVIAWECLKSLD